MAIKRKRKYTRFKPKEKRFNFDDSKGAKYYSERTLNVVCDHDRSAYEYVRRNQKSLLRQCDVNHKDVIRRINASTGYRYDIDPRSVRKGYVKKVISGIDD